jgi:uncharacterized membrane protein (UPF0127 family)
MLLCLMSVTACQAKDEITIQTPSGDQAVFLVDVARTYQETQQGLMFVEEMPEERGMIFLYPRPIPLKFWMKNTLIPLDILFFDSTNTLVHIERNATPHDLSPRGPETPTCTVVELNANIARKYEIEIGSKLLSDLPDECLQSSMK